MDPKCIYSDEYGNVLFWPPINPQDFVEELDTAKKKQRLQFDVLSINQSLIDQLEEDIDTNQEYEYYNKINKYPKEEIIISDTESDVSVELVKNKLDTITISNSCSPIRLIENSTSNSIQLIENTHSVAKNTDVKSQSSVSLVENSNFQLKRKYKSTTSIRLVENSASIKSKTIQLIENSHCTI